MENVVAVVVLEKIAMKITPVENLVVARWEKNA